MKVETTIQQKPKLLELEKQSSIFKLVVTTELEEKIRYYLRRFPSIEYSGTLFYKVEGTFEKDLVVTGIDFLLQDIGTSGYTEFDQSPDVIGYMVDHPELLGENIYQGLMHSHHTLGAFFSGTDISTLREEGTDRTHFVSLIIDTKGEYKAAITRIVEEEVVATGKVKYNTFNNNVVTAPVKYSFTRKKMDWFSLDVIKPNYNYIDPFEEMNNRIIEVNKQKAAKPKPAYNNYQNAYSQYNKTGWTPPQNETQTTIQKQAVVYQTGVGKGNMTIPQNNYVPPTMTIKQNELPFEEEDNDSPPAYGILTLNPTILELAAKQILCGTVVIPEDNQIDLSKMANSMKTIYDSRFESLHTFEDWATQHLEFIIYDIYDVELVTLDVDTSAAIAAFDLIKKFEELPKNEYIDIFIELLKHYLI